MRGLNRLVIAVAVVVVLAVILVMVMNSSPTGQLLAGTENTQISQQKSQPANMGYDPRVKICEGMNVNYDECLEYLYKICSVDSQCGPFSCVINKCQ